jgi:hypothetical protein
MDGRRLLLKSLRSAVTRRIAYRFSRSEVRQVAGVNVALADKDGGVVVGSIDRFALRIAPCAPDTGGQMRNVALFVDGVRLPCRDTWVYVPHFASAIEETSAKLKSTLNWFRYEQEFGERNLTERHEFLRLDDSYRMARYHFHCFMDWGETTDDVKSFLIPYQERLYLTYQMATYLGSGELWEYSVVNGLEVRPFDLICILDEAADILHRGLQPPPSP